MDNEFADDRIDCETCGRKFNQDRIDRHLDVCRMNKQKENERKRRRKKTPEPEPQLQEKKTTKWREQHNNFLEIVAYNRKLKECEAKGGDVRAIKRPEAQIPSDYVNCPHCERNFDPLVAERHVPKCALIISKPKPPKRDGSQSRQTQQVWVKKYSEGNKMTMTRDEGWSDSNLRTQQIPPMKRKKESTAVVTPVEKEDTSVTRATTQTSKVSKANSISRRKEPNLLGSVRNPLESSEQNKGQRTAPQQLPELKNTKYQSNWTKIGFVDLQTRATLISDTTCPHCGRNFLARAALRHIPICEKLTSKSSFHSKLSRETATSLKATSLPKRKITEAKIVVPQVTRPKPTENDVFLGLPKFCAFCGNKFSATHKYCGGCGKKREQSNVQ